MTSDRTDALEEALAHQEAAIEDLSEVVKAQAAEIATQVRLECMN